MEKRTVAFDRDRSNLFFHLLTKCNLSCRHCYINPSAHGDNTLDIKTIREWLALFAQKAKQTNVIFLGGEPTLHPDLSLAVKEAKRLGFLSITIDTNGYLFHDILEKVTPDEVDYLSFSLDGPVPGVNDPIRGEGSYEQCTAGIRKAVARGFHTSLIYTVSGENLSELHKMPALIAELGIHRFFIQVIGIRGQSADDDTGLQVTKKDWLETVPGVADDVAKLGIKVTYPKVFLEEDEPFQCAGLVADNYFIFPNGRVYRCPICEDHPLHSLEIRDGALIAREKITETDLFNLSIPEGCVMNKLIQPGNLAYNEDGTPAHRIACCLLKEEVCNPLEE